MRTFAILLSLAGLLAVPSAVRAQEPWPKLVIRVGALIADLGSEVRIDGPGGTEGTSIDLQDDLGFTNQATTFFASATWRISRRNQLHFDYEGVRRDVTRAMLARTITFQGQTFTAGTEAAAFFDTLYLSADYGFAFVTKPHVEVGASIGVTLLRAHSGIGLAVDAEGSSVSRDLADNVEFNVPVPLPGIFVSIRPHPRVTIISDTRFMKAHFSDIRASYAEATVGVDVTIARAVGAGAAYYYNRTNVDRARSSSNGRIVYAFSGPQAYVTFCF